MSAAGCAEQLYHCVNASPMLGAQKRRPWAAELSMGLPGVCRYASMKPLQAGDVAQAVVWCLSAPDHVDTNDILMRPVEQET